MIAAIVPAAGSSSRMGNPKALLEFRGKSFLATIVDAAGACGLDPRIVVLGAEAGIVLSKHDLSGVSVVTNPEPDSGPIGSIRAALATILNQPVEGALVWHVDRPHVAIGTVEALLARFRRGGVAIVVPSYRGRRGHPVIFGRAVFEELLKAPASEGARSVVRKDPSRVGTVDVEDPAVVDDIDTPEDYRRLLAGP